jgi:hypothetical protein
LVNRTRAAYLHTGLVVIAGDSAFVLMPGQSRAALAAVVLIVSVGGAAYFVLRIVRMVRRDPPSFTSDLIVRRHIAGSAWLLAIWAGISLLTGVGGVLFFPAFAVSTASEN